MIYDELKTFLELSANSFYFSELFFVLVKEDLKKIPNPLLFPSLHSLGAKEMIFLIKTLAFSRLNLLLSVMHQISRY